MDRTKGDGRAEGYALTPVEGGIRIWREEKEREE